MSKIDEAVDSLLNEEGSRTWYVCAINIGDRYEAQVETYTLDADNIREALIEFLGLDLDDIEDPDELFNRNSEIFETYIIDDDAAVLYEDGGWIGGMASTKDRASRIYVDLQSGGDGDG